MLKLFDRRGMRCSPYSSSVINTNHVVNIVSAPKSVNVPYQSGKSTLPNVSLSIRKKHPSKLQLKSITFQILQNLLFQWRVIVWMNTHVGLELDGVVVVVVLVLIPVRFPVPVLVPDPVSWFQFQFLFLFLFL